MTLGFKYLTVNYTHLHEWIGQKNFETKDVHPDGSYDIAYKPFRSVNVLLEDVEIEVGYKYFHPELLKYNRHLPLKDESLIAIKPHNPAVLHLKTISFT